MQENISSFPKRTNLLRKKTALSYLRCSPQLEILWKIKGFVAILRQDMSGGIFVFLLGER